MDSGQIFKTTFTIYSGEDETFIVRLGHGDDRQLYPGMWGFSSVDDLLDWLKTNAKAFKASGKEDSQ